ncbi:LOW QUALITY PROTEIN: hypothetical protein Cgig2_026460 [Carnegiea gigantea]|uniref:Uncharacterized protein n=1 Tax=Carnegiea gigantea TaxID=171969 RepID=A0A9Q1KBX6_9CARY|nr:LOW QUALITY PROTEIN: hypothetical protein Cgig2_026460 [Carnegiea gigantea]
MVQATFYTILLNATLEGLRWTTFESWLNVSKRALLEAQLRERIPLESGPGPMGGQEESSGSNDPRPPSNDEYSWSFFIARSFRKKNLLMAFPDFFSTEQTAHYVRATFLWFLREDSHPLRPLYEDYHGLCPYFTLNMAKESAQDFCIPEMTQAIFYAMNAVELGVTSEVTGGTMASILKSLSWDILESCFISVFNTPFNPSSSSQERRMAKTKTITWLRSPNELLAEGTSEGNPRSSSDSHRSSVEVELIPPAPALP